MDHVDNILAQWARERPDLDATPIAVIGRLTRAAVAVDVHLGANYARHGIDAATFDVLATLARQGAPYRMTPAGLAADAMITSSAVAQRLNRLDALGLITRRPDPADGRGKLVELTASGKDLLDRVLPEHLATEARILRNLDDDQRATLAVLLSRIAPDAPGR